MLSKSKRGKKNTLRKEITMLLILAALLPLMAVTTGSFYVLNKSLRDDYKTIIKSNTDRVIEVLTGVVGSSSDSVFGLAVDPNAMAILSNSDSPMWLFKALDSFVQTRRNVANAYVGTVDGKMILAPKQELSKDFDPRTRPWYKDAIAKEGNVIMTDPYMNDGEEKVLVVSFAKAVKDDNGKLVGVAAIDVKLSELSQIISRITIGKNGFAMVLSSKGQVIAHKDSDKVGKTGKELTWVGELIELEKEDFLINIEGIEYIGFKNIDKDSGIIVTGVVPADEIFNKILVTIVLPLIVVIVSIIAVIIAGMLFSRKITNPINRLVTVLDKVKGGDFSQKVTWNKNSSAEISMIIEAVNSTIDDMTAILNSVKFTSGKVREASEVLLTTSRESSAVGEEVARAVEQIAAGATEQAAQLNESVVISNSLGNEVDRSIKDSQRMIGASAEVKNSTVEGLKIVNSLLQVFDENSRANNQVVSRVSLLAEKSNEISIITDTIKSITEQTNLLALNASIEAARAGEAGRGFAVVAEEVRKLAEESSKSASEIGKVIEEIKYSINSLLEQIKYSQSINDKTGDSVKVTNDSFIKIEKEMRGLEEIVERVGESLKQINSSKEQVVIKISEVSSVSQETAATTEEVSASTEEQSAGLQEIVLSAQQLAEMAEKLDAVVAKFKI